MYRAMKELADMLISRAGLDVEDIPRIRERMAVLAIGLEIGKNGTDPQDLSIHLATIGIWPKKLLGSALGKDWKRTSSHHGAGSVRMSISSRHCPEANCFFREGKLTS
jgi:hypothetical protein